MFVVWNFYSQKKQIFTQDRSDPLFELNYQLGAGAIINGDLMMDFPRPLFHNLWYLGTRSSGSKGKELPDEFRQILENPKGRGLILMSFGTMANVTYMPEDMKVGANLGMGIWPISVEIWPMNVEVDQYESHDKLHTVSTSDRLYNFYGKLL